MKKDLAAILAECLDGIRSGEFTLEECLQRHPEHRSELRSLLAVADRLSAAPPAEPSPAFRRFARARLMAKLPPRAAAPVTFSDRLRTLRAKPEAPVLHRRPKMVWALVVAVVVALTGGGGVGLAYAADGSSPGSPLYGLDRAVESVRLALARSPEARVQLATAFAQERLAELENLIGAGGSDAEIQQALDGYGENISQAAADLAAVAATGDPARAAALANLLDQALAVHTQVLTDVKGRVPDEVQAKIDSAIGRSQAAKDTIDGLFSEGMPGGPPEGTPGGPSDSAPSGPPDAAAAGAPDGIPDGLGGAPEEAGPPGELLSFEERVAQFQARLDQARANIENGDLQGAEAVLIENENKVDELAQDLAAVARDDILRAAALAALLDEALSIQTEILTQLLDQVPAQGRDAVEGAITRTEAGRALIRQLFDNGFPGGWFDGFSTGLPGGPP